MSNVEIKSDLGSAKLTIKINNKLPVDLSDYSQSMLSLSAEYSEYITRSEGHLLAEDIKLYVNHIETGSIITELIALAPAMMPFVEHTNTVLDFTKHLKSSIDYIKNFSNTQSDERKISSQEIQRVIKFVEPIAKDDGAVMQVDASNNTGTINIHFNSNEAKAIKENGQSLLEIIKEPLIGLHKRVVLYWVQARSDNKRGNKAKIESISKKEVKVVFDDDELKNKILHDQPHPFDYAYIVDVHVETVKGEPALYRVIKFYETIDLNE